MGLWAFQVRMDIHQNMIANKIITIVGPHAQEDLDIIIKRKRADIKANGFAMWFFRKNKYCDELSIKNNYEVYFCLPKANNAASPTKMARSAIEYSFDNILWTPIGNLNTSSVTGNIVKNSICLTIRELSETLLEIDIGRYKNIMGTPIKINQFFSTQIGIYDENYNNASNIRRVAFIGKLYGNGFCYIR